MTSSHCFTTLSGPMTNSILRLLALFLAILSATSCSLTGYEEATTEISYTIKPGDTLYKLSERYDISVDELIKINDISDPNKLKVGQVLIIRLSDNIGSVRSRPKKPKKSVKLPPIDSLGISLKSPLDDFRIISKFGKRALNFHEGIDFKAKEGRDIYAAHSGLVIFSGSGLSGYGNMIALRGHGYMTIYAHNSRNFVNRGDYISAGDKIGLTGATGRVTGPHLHFELRIKASDDRYYAVDPLPLFYLKENDSKGQ